ncbi:MAG: type 2 lanthipeptide synthetase LanM, partial [Aggregatilineales bacterium]
MKKSSLYYHIYLSSIHHQAQFLHERFDHEYIPQQKPLPDEDYQAIMSQWAIAVCGEDDRDMLMQVLDRQGYATNRLPRVLNSSPKLVPIWTDALMAWLYYPLPEPAPDFFDSQKPIAFETVFTPIVSMVADMLEHTDLLTPDAVHMLKRDLLRNLCRIAGQSLLIAFKHSQHSGTSRLARLVATAPDEQYKKFVAKLRGDGILTLFETYPVLGRWLGTYLLQYLQHIDDVLLQFQCTDFSALEAAYTEEPRHITRIQPGLSDAHRDGKTVTLLKLANGNRLIYKPRSLAMEALFNHVIAWINAQDTTLDLKTIPLIDGGDYGWMQFVTQKDCPDESAIGRFYQRLGMLLALVHLLEGTDIHSENLIAHGEYPMIVDCETLLTPRRENHDFFSNPVSATDIAQQQLRRSALRTAMLPDAHYHSAIATADKIVSNDTYPMLVNVNRDDMKIVMQPQSQPVHQNVPHLNGNPIPVTDYIDDLLAGYAEIYRLIHRDPTAFIAQLPDENLPGRFLLRPTEDYAQLQRQMTQPAMLRDGIQAGIVLE